MNNTELIRELRALTSAGMKDCRVALEETDWDLQKAVDVIKVKGLNIADGRTGRVATEGRVAIGSPTFALEKNLPHKEIKSMIEINCETDFVANSPAFRCFTDGAAAILWKLSYDGQVFYADNMEEPRKQLVASTKENITVRRWWVEEAQTPTVKVFSYLHSNNKIGVLITMQAPTEVAANSPEFKTLGEELAMQICAMNPLAVSADRLSLDEISHQRTIFETQLKEEKKPEKMWGKIIEGKLNKWYRDVCLSEQESVIVPKTTVKQVIDNVATKLGGEIKVINFVRCQVGEGLEKKQDNLAEEVAKLTDDQIISQNLIDHLVSKVKV